MLHRESSGSPRGRPASRGAALAWDLAKTIRTNAAGRSTDRLWALADWLPYHSGCLGQRSWVHDTSKLRSSCCPDDTVSTV